MYKIKQIPEDFTVKEVNELVFVKDGQYSYYLLKKRSYNTIDAIKKICEVWRINEKIVNFAGIKDRNAITEQFISINHGVKKDLELKDISLTFLGCGDVRLNLGELSGNSFEITVRNVKAIPKNKKLIINYFDDQRFGVFKNNHIVGKHILKGEFNLACNLIEECREMLDKKPNDYIFALRSLPKKTLKLYVHAYQSHLWNIAAAEISKEMKKNTPIPIIGFGTSFKNKHIEKVYKKIMVDEKIDLRSFINRRIPELSEEGAERELYVSPEKLKIGDLENDELNEGFKKVKIEFFLRKGAYATNVIKTMFE